MKVVYIIGLCLIVLVANSTRLTAASASTHAAAASENLVTNSSFEELQDKKLTGWTPHYRSAKADDRKEHTKEVTFVISNKANSGARAAAITLKGLAPEVGIAYWEQSVHIKPNTRYRLSVMAMKEGLGWGSVVLAPKTKDFHKAAESISAKVPNDSAGKYTKMEQELTTGKDTEYLSIELRANAGTMTLWFDDVTLVELPGESQKP